MQPQSRPARRAHGDGSLYTRTDSSGREKFYGRWWHDGKQVKRAIGYKRTSSRANDGLTERQAEKELRRLMHEYAPTATTDAAAPDGAKTVTDAVRGHITQREAKNLKPATITHYRSLAKNQVIPFMGSRAIAEIGPKDIEALMAFMLASETPDGDPKRKLSEKTVRHALTYLNGVFEYAIREDWITENPCKRVERPKVRRKPIRFLTVEEVEQLARSMPTFARATDDPLRPIERVLYLAAAMTGLRQGELLGLRWRDVDFAAETIRVLQNYSQHLPRGEFGTPKSNKSRTVPLAPNVATALDELSRHTEWSGDDDLVFAHPATGDVLYNPARVLRRFHKALTAAGLREITFHELRHTFGTTLAKAGTPIREIQEYMGHAHISTTEQYAHYAPRPDAAARIAAAFRVDMPEPEEAKTAA